MCPPARILALALIGGLACHGSSDRESDSIVTDAATDAVSPDGSAGDLSAADVAPTPIEPASGRCTPDRAIAQIYFNGDSSPPVGGPRFDFRRSSGVVLMLRYDRSGPDVRWWTEDDVLTSYYRVEVVAGVRRTMQFGDFGPDRTWLTTDDAAGDASTILCEPLDGQGRPRGWLELASAGPDGIPCTDDDVVSSAYRIEYAGKSVSRQIGSGSAGPDNRWLTADDPVSWWARFDNDADGAPREVYYTDQPGPDLQWFTGDDLLKLLTTWTYSGNEESEETVVGNIHGNRFGWHRYCHPPAPVAALF